MPLDCDEASHAQLNQPGPVELLRCRTRIAVSSPSGSGTRDEVALGEIEAEVGQYGQLRRRRGALGDDVEVEPPADPDDRLAERPQLGVAVDPGDQRAVQLDDVMGNGQVGQCRGAAAKAVQRDVHAHQAQRGEVQRGPFAVGERPWGGHRQDQPLRRETRPAQRVLDVGDERAGRERNRPGDFLPKRSGGLARRQATRQAAASLQGPAHHVADQPAALGEREELRRRDLPEGRGAASAAAPRCR